MNLTISLVFLFIKYSLCDWIEIRQSSNHAGNELLIYSTSFYLHSVKLVGSTKKSAHKIFKSTPVPYEVFMVTPSTRIGSQITTISNDENDGTTSSSSTTNQMENSLFTTTESNTPKSVNEEHPNMTEDIVTTQRSKPAQKKSTKKPNNSINYEGFQSFINGIQANLLDRKNKSAHNKLTLLRNLRDHLLVNIGKIEIHK